MSTTITLKWNKSTFDNVEIGDLKTGLDFKKKCQELTGVHPDRQKIMGLGAGILKDNQELSAVKVKAGQLVRMMGSADELPEPPKEKTVFIEDTAKENGDGEVVSNFDSDHKYSFPLSNIIQLVWKI